jgi:hypothetical protein
MMLQELKRLYRQANPEGHYFDKAALRFFGSQSQRARPSGIDGVILYSEFQANAPDGVDRWRAQLFDTSGRMIGGSYTAETRAGAEEAAVRAY